MRRILCLYLPNWPIQRLLAGRNVPAPILLHARDPRRGDVIVAANSPASERGVRLNMPLAEAAALAQHGGKCHIEPHDPGADMAELARLAEHGERFSPIVGWNIAGEMRNAGAPAVTRVGGVRSTGPDCLFLDISGIGILFGGEQELGREAVADMKRLGYEIRVAVADTIGAAWASASRKDAADIQVLSTENAVPLFRTPHSAFRTLPVGSLRLPAETVDLLSQLGIVRLDELLALPRESLRARFGELLLLRIDQLLGTAQEMIVPHRPPPRFVEEWVLEYPAEGREQIEKIVRELAHRVATALANRREGVLKLTCRLDCAPGRPMLLEVGLFRPSADEQHLLSLLQMQLEQATLPGPVGRVRLEATLTAPLENRQGELFAGDQHEAARQFALLIDRCSSRLGPDAVLRPQLTADPLPERAVRYRTGVRGQGPGAKRTRNAERETRSVLYSALRTPRSALLRPLTLHSPPQSIDVLSIAPDGPPVSFCFQGQQYEVAGRSGPERIETGWWRGKSVHRDYWRVGTTTGQRFWLFHQLANGKWFLHGEYA